MRHSKNPYDEEQLNNEDMSTPRSSTTHEDADFSDERANAIADENRNASTINGGDRVTVFWPDDKAHYKKP